MKAETIIPLGNNDNNVEIARRFGWKLKRTSDTEEMAKIVAALLCFRSDSLDVLEQTKLILSKMTAPKKS